MTLSTLGNRKNLQGARSGEYFRSLFSNLGIIFCNQKCSNIVQSSRSQIFLIPRSTVMIVHTLPLFMLTTFAIILTLRQRSLCTFSHTHLNIFVCSPCCWLSAPEIIFHILFSSSELAVPLKNLSSRHPGISIDSCSKLNISV